MKVKWEKKGTKLIFKFSPSPKDQTEGLKSFRGVDYSMDKYQCYFRVPSDWDIAKTHQDLLAAAAIMIIEPYVHKEIKLEEPVSCELADTFSKHFNKNIYPKNINVRPRVAPKEGRPGLSYSGGVDSTVAAMLLPLNTELIFAERDSSGSNQPGSYNKASSVFACEAMEKIGHRVNMILTDYEFIRKPVGFAWGISSAVPALIMADYLKLDSLAFGMILESAYGIGDHGFRQPINDWRDILVAAGLPYNLVTAGMSEVATTKIITKYPEYYALSQSCIRGDIKKPCGKCIKCFRKLMLEVKINEENIDDLKLENIMILPEIYNHITRQPVHHENIYSYALSTYSGNSKIIKLFAKKCRASSIKVDWMEKWYQPSEGLIYSKYKSFVTNKIKQEIKTMKSEDEDQLEKWSPSSLMNSPKGYFYRRAHKMFMNKLDEIKNAN